MSITFIQQQPEGDVTLPARISVYPNIGGSRLCVRS